MKNLLILFIFCLSTILSAQEYTPMLADVNEWHFTTCFDGDCYEDVYYTDGEIEVEGNEYKVLDGYHYISREFLLREELDTKQVYLATIFGGSFREYLLYDFSLTIGDQFEMKNPITPFPSEGGMFTLDDIQLLELADGNLYKHFYFSPSPGNTVSDWNPVWVEGVGSLSIPNAPGGNPSIDSAGRVSCAFRNGDIFYTDFNLVEDCTPTILSVTMQPEDSSVFVISTNDSIVIKSSKEISAYDLFDISGKLVQSDTVNKLQEVSFDVPQLKSGVYFLRIKGEHFISLQKVFIK